MRKMLALLLVVVLVFALASVVFADDGSPSPTGTTAENPDKPVDPVSPSTGDPIQMLAPIMLLGLFGAIVATRKLVKNH